MTTDSLDIVQESPERLPWHRRLLDSVLFWFVVLPCAATLLALLAPRLHWRLDLLTSFHHIYAMALLGLLIPLSILRPRRKVLLSLAAVGLLINAALIAPLFWGRGAATADAPRLRVAFMNVLRTNQDDARTVEWLRRTDPDVIIINELTSHHDALIRREFPGHRHGAAEPDEGYYGIGLFSRVPLNRARIELFGEFGEPSVLAEIELDGEPIMLASSHLYPPLNADLTSRRNAQARDLADAMARQPRPLLFAGDLNMSSWSPNFRDLTRAARLRDGRRGFGLRGTWPDFLRGWGVTIDHVLHSSELAITSHEVGPRIGSDHLPIVVEVTLKR